MVLRSLKADFRGLWQDSWLFDQVAVFPEICSLHGIIFFPVTE